MIIGGKLTMQEDFDMLDAYKQALEMIRDIGADYDGYHSKSDLKALIDELVGFARNGLKGQRPQYLGQGKVYEWIDRKMIEVPEEKWNDSVKEWKKLPGW
jgi:hypothetical protein